MAAHLTPAENLVSKLNATMQLQQATALIHSSQSNQNISQNLTQNSMNSPKIQQNSSSSNMQNSPNLTISANINSSINSTINSNINSYQSVTFTDDNLPSNMLTQFHDWQQSSTLVDCQIIIKNNPPIKAHKLVLANSCNFFCTAFQAPNFKNQSSGDQLPTINIDYISEKGFQAILDYCYSGKIRVASEHAGDVLVASSYLQVPAKIIEFCAKFYEKIQPKKSVVQNGMQNGIQNGMGNAGQGVQNNGMMNPPTTPPAQNSTNNSLMSLIQNLITNKSNASESPISNSNLSNLVNILNGNGSGSNMVLQNLLNRSETSPVVQQSDSGKLIFFYCIVFSDFLHDFFIFHVFLPPCMFF